MWFLTSLQKRLFKIIQIQIMGFVIHGSFIVILLRFLDGLLLNPHNNIASPTFASAHNLLPSIFSPTYDYRLVAQQEGEQQKDQRRTVWRSCMYLDSH